MASSSNPKKEALHELKAIEKETAQLKKEASTVHHESLKSTQRMMKMATEARDAGASTLQDLASQGEQLDRIEGDQFKIETNLKEAHHQLNKLERYFYFMIPRKSNRKIKKVAYERRQEREEQEKAEEHAQREEMRRLEKAKRDAEVFARKHPELVGNLTGRNVREELLRREQEEAQEKKRELLAGGTLTQPSRTSSTMRREDEEMDRNLETVGSLVDEMRVQSEELGRVIDQQNEQLDRIQKGVDLNYEDARFTAARTRHVRTGIFDM